MNKLAARSIVLILASCASSMASAALVADGWVETCMDNVVYGKCKMAKAATDSHTGISWNCKLYKDGSIKGSIVDQQTFQSSVGISRTRSITTTFSPNTVYCLYNLSNWTGPTSNQYSWECLTTGGGGQAN